MPVGIKLIPTFDNYLIVMTHWVVDVLFVRSVAEKNWLLFLKNFIRIKFTISKKIKIDFLIYLPLFLMIQTSKL